VPVLKTRQEKPMRRRTFMGTAASIPLTIAAASGRAQGAEGKTYVLVHGTWCGGWFFGPLAENLRRQDHRVFSPTHTGTGERKHLLSSDIMLETFILDVKNLIEAEALTDLMLAGHSSAGLTITAVADRSRTASGIWSISTLYWSRRVGTS
jgi:hypothetical protein